MLCYNSKDRTRLEEMIFDTHTISLNVVPIVRSCRRQVEITLLLRWA